MAGNIWEWCLNEYNEPANVGVSGEAGRVVRGGSWYSYSVNCGAAYRFGDRPVNRNYYLGLRLVVCVVPIRGTKP
jgi:formylglycine-generating enzyme required for sulfatase activity